MYSFYPEVVLFIPISLIPPLRYNFSVEDDNKEKSVEDKDDGHTVGIESHFICTVIKLFGSSFL